MRQLPPWTAQWGSLSWDAVIQEQLDSPWGHKPCPKPDPAWSPLSKSQGPTRCLLQSSFPMGLQPPPDIHLLWWGVIHGLQVDLRIPTVLLVLQGHLTMVSMGWRGICSGNWSNSWPPSPLTLVPAGLFLSHILILLFSGLNYCCTASFFPFLSVLSQRHYCGCWLALPSGGPILEPAGIGPFGNGESFCQFPTETTCLDLSTPTTKTLPRKPNMSTETG